MRGMEVFMLVDPKIPPFLLFIFQLPPPFPGLENTCILVMVQIGALGFYKKI